MRQLHHLATSLHDGHIPPAEEEKPPPADQKVPEEKKEGEPEEKLQHRFQLKRMEIKDPEYMSEVPIHLQNDYIPGFPTTCMAVGEPGSGKTNLLINLLTREDMWKGFFDRIYLLGPTINSDKLYQHLKIPKSQIVTDQKQFIPKLVEWTNQQIDEVERDPEKAPKCLFIFEDITSYYHTAQSSPDFTKCFNAIRHHKATAYANIHKVKALQRTARMSCRHIMVFPVNKTEIFQIYEDYGPKMLTKWDFFEMCKDAWKPDELSKKPFLYINKCVKEEEKKFRKCFTHILPVDQYVGRGKPPKAPASAKTIKNMGHKSGQQAPYQKPPGGTYSQIERDLLANVK